MARPRKFDEATVIEAVQDKFWTNGYEATSLEDLMEVTGLGKGSLYGAFGDKRTLFLRVFENYCTDAIEGVREMLSGDDAGALSRLQNYLMTSTISVARDTRHRGCFLSKSTAELALSDEDVATKARHTYQALEDLFIASLEQAKRHGDISATADTKRLGALISTVVRGIEALGRSGVEEATLRGTVETTIAALRNAL